jgi:two-component system response regulator AtoC
MKLTGRAMLGWASVLAAVPVALVSRRLFMYLAEQANAAGGLSRYAGQMWGAMVGACILRPNVDLCTSAAMRFVRSLTDRVARTDATVLILGESGVGKEVVARTIHARSERASRPFVKVNCAALPHDLLESELFGHEKGAFTHAYTMRRGWFEQANGGTLFLDEITEVPVDLQAKLLHVLQDGEFFRIGGQRPIATDVQVIAATHRDLRAAIAAGEFREDVYYRLNVIEIHVPPLRERRDEIPGLVRHFCDGFAAMYGRPVELDAATLDLFMRYDWPGNVRELENTVHRIAVLGTAAALGAMMPQPVAGGSAARGDGDDAVMSLKERGRLAAREAERVAIATALETARWNRSAAARALQISVRALRYKMAELGLIRGTTEERQTPPDRMAS